MRWHARPKNVACNQGEHARMCTALEAATSGGASGITVEPNTALVLSNAPENIGSQVGSFPAILYSCPAPVSIGGHNFRVYLWHFNETEHNPLYISVIARIGNFQVPLSETKVQVGRMAKESDLLAVGKCLAKAQLY